MVKPDALEGVIDNTLWFHYDISGDVLYLRLASHRDAPALGEDQPDGTVLLRHEGDDQVVGVTVINWWKRFGAGSLPDSFQEVGRRIHAWAAGKIAA